MEKDKPKITEFFDSKGRSIEEIVGHEVEGTFEPTNEIHPWWKQVVTVLRNKEVPPKPGQD